MYRRDYERFEQNSSATLLFNNATAEKFILENISARGAGVFGYRPLRINDKVTIIFQIPQLFDKPIHKVAKIVWSKMVNENLWEGGLDFGLDNILNILNKEIPI